MTFDEWLDFGIEKGFCSKPVCGMHDGLPMSEEEEQALEEGSDPCVVMVRLSPPEG